MAKDGAAKVADVGLSGLSVMAGYFSSSGNTAGTFHYAAPELLLALKCTDKIAGLDVAYLVRWSMDACVHVTFL